MHSSLHERCIQLSQLVTNELNNEFGSLFQEKKYKDLMVIAKEQQGDQLLVFASQVQQLASIATELALLS